MEHVTDLSTYEAFTCLPEGNWYDTTHLEIDRDPYGRLYYDWKKNTEPLNAAKEQFLQKKKMAKSGSG